MGRGWLTAAELTSAWCHLGKGPRGQQTRSAVTSVAPRMSAPSPGSSDSHSQEKTDATAAGVCTSGLNTELEQRGESAGAQSH